MIMIITMIIIIIINSQTFPNTLKSDPEAAHDGNEKCITGSPYENHHFRALAKFSKSGPEAATPGIWILWKDLLMKSITSRQLAKKLKSGPEAAKPGNEGFVKGSPYEKCNFRAACQNLQILAWSRHAWRRKVCKEISLCLEGGVFIRRSFYQAFISLCGGSITRFPGLGQRPGNDYFHKEILSQIFHFQAWRLRTRSQGFGHRFASDYDYFEKTWILSLLAPVSGFKVFAMAWKRFLFFVDAFL